MQILNWSAMDDRAREEALSRPALAASSSREATVATIIRNVKDGGDKAVRYYTRTLDGADVESPLLSETGIREGASRLDEETRAAIDRAFETIRAFHLPSGRQEYAVETAPGVSCRRLVRPLSSVGLYVPGGSAPLPSTVLMLGIPAMLAGCERVVMCTPPGKDGGIAPAILHAARRCGIRTIIRAGGAQAIAAMAHGTETIPRVDKLFGPGNAWVTEAKRQLADVVPIDMPAGPSEVLVIADESSNPVFVASDLLSQAEHGADSQVLLVTPSSFVAETVQQEIKRQLQSLPRRDVAEHALRGSRILVVETLRDALMISNRYAPEHLILNVAEPVALLDGVRNAGSVFLGAWTPESLGDYASGTNHVLPTYGHARQLSGLGVADFQKSMTVQEATPTGLSALGPVAVAIARAEGLEAHARAVTVRLAVLEDDQEAQRERA